MLLVIGAAVLATANDIQEDARLDTVISALSLQLFFLGLTTSLNSQVQLLRKYGYNGEYHTVTTADGYILGVHRCAGGPRSPPRAGKPVVFVMHGMLSSSADFVLMGPNTALVYMLADLGYDVWLGNSRGNRYSNTHTRLDNSTRQYWDFSWHEIGVRDLPAMIDFALARTGQRKLHYIGHSMGTTVYLVRFD